MPCPCCWRSPRGLNGFFAARRASICEGSTTGKVRLFLYRTPARGCVENVGFKTHIENNTAVSAGATVLLE
jgi:hypothetical protein